MTRRNYFCWKFNKTFQLFTAPKGIFFGVTSRKENTFSSVHIPILRNRQARHKMLHPSIPVTFRTKNSAALFSSQNVRKAALLRFKGIASNHRQHVSGQTNGKKHVTALILGKPGGGKGTISGKILEDFPAFYHLSTGDVLRQHVRSQTDIGKEAKKHMDAGHLVPDDLMIRLVLEDAMEDVHASGHLLLDGFPRTIQQAVALEKALHVDLVINLDVPTETIVERISDRWIHAPSGRVYSYSYKAPKQKGIDDKTGEPLIQRNDDKPESVRKRLDAYEKITAPLVEYYRNNGVLKTFHGTMSDVIYIDVKAWLEEQLK